MNNREWLRLARKVFIYDRGSGEFRWKEDRFAGEYGSVLVGRKGELAGTINPGGYVQLSLGGKCVRAHRVAWLLVYGEWPKGPLDHENKIKTDNRISNLRLATHAQNGRNRGPNKNNTSGRKGVTWFASRGKWMAQITVDRKRKFLGYFTDIDEAAKAYEKAAAELHRDYAST